MEKLEETMNLKMASLISLTDSKANEQADRIDELEMQLERDKIQSSVQVNVLQKRFDNERKGLNE